MTLSKYALIVLCAALPAAAQNPISDGERFLYNMVKGNIVKTAEKVPEDLYSFKPAPEVKTMAQMLGHVADANYMFCAAVLGEKAPSPGVEKTMTTKAEIVPAVKAAFAYCDKAYEQMTDAEGVKVIKFFGREMSKATVLGFNSFHTMEHYGNLVTYMRIKGIVPPSSEGR
ncbi:MAG TPA: DinB family protein [Bryobacteraceae bacterium]|nr:DinB family protein [Bryobacteraceae bacterium]